MPEVPIPDPAAYDWVVVNSSAGKDSQAMTDYVAGLARDAGVLSRVVLLHCDLGRIEWPGTRELAQEHAAHYGLRFEVVRRPQVGDLLAEVNRRGKWPSQGQRYCTSYYKRDQAKKVYTALARESGRPVRILNCLGFRSEESPRRRKLPRFCLNAKASSGRKAVYDWLPLQDWTLAQVWDRIGAAGTRPHPAYALGMTRLSCRFCIFAPRSQLVLSGRHNPELLAEYVETERRIGHTFRVNLSLTEVQQAVRCGEEPAPDDGAWNM